MIVVHNDTHTHILAHSNGCFFAPCTKYSYLLTCEHVNLHVGLGLDFIFMCWFKHSILIAFYVLSNARLDHLFLCCLTYSVLNGT